MVISNDLARMAPGTARSRAPKMPRVRASFRSWWCAGADGSRPLRGRAGLSRLSSSSRGCRTPVPTRAAALAPALEGLEGGRSVTALDHKTKTARL